MSLVVFAAVAAVLLLLLLLLLLLSSPSPLLRYWLCLCLVRTFFQSSALGPI